MTAPRVLRARPLASEQFAPYGDVIAGEGPQARLVNEGRALRYDGLASLEHAPEAQRPALSTYRVQASRFPVSVGLFERHSHSSQVFVPMEGGPYLVGVTRADQRGAPDLGRAEAFVAPAGIGIHYRPGIWHVPMVALGREAVFAMIMWETGLDDTIEWRLPHPLLIEA